MAAAAFGEVVRLFPTGHLDVKEESEEATESYGGNTIKLNYDYRLLRKGCWIGGVYHNVKPWGRRKVTEDSEKVCSRAA